MRVVALIPARGGSKSLPRKNIKLLGGIPLIAYSIAAGLQAQTIDHTIVSTDDEEIANIARQYGARVPFMRPSELAQDDTLDLPVFEHALEWLEKNEGYHADAIVQLRPTSPFRPRDLVDRAVQTLVKHREADSVRAVVASSQNPYKMWKLSADGFLTPLLQNEFREPFNMPRQRLPATYFQTGHIDVIRAETILQQHSMSGQVIYPVQIPSEFQIDIDTPLDWEYAEWALAHRGIEITRPPSAYAPDWERIRLLALDFDGVLTDNRVWVDQDGKESVVCNRSDGWGIAQLQAAGIPVVVVSTEINPVVAARCRKLNIPYVQGCSEKLAALQELAGNYNQPAANIAYVGNDENDLACLNWVGLPIAVSNATEALKEKARVVTRAPGGYGAVREVCDLILINKPRGRNEQIG